jgi:EAL domain-containing protein (putative c-di-GMP-specific phosphodiesterase class I)
MFDKSYTAAGELLRDADSAMYRAKALGGNQHHLFDSTLHASAVELIKLEGELKRAVERHEWLIHYQPIVSLESGELIGAEALLRWSHPQRGVLSPNAFIDVAEDTGLILNIGDYILRTTCAQAQAWRASGHPNFWVSVNLSARQFQDSNLVEKMTRILTETGLPSDGLRLEITESVAIQNMERSIMTISKFEDMGISVSLDDFGTGYSSLSYLRQFPLKALKIDRSFIQDIHLNKKNEALIMAIIAMARSLGLEVVAEGVEKQEQLSFLRMNHCNYAQGFLLGRPIPREEFLNVLSNKKNRITND